MGLAPGAGCYYRLSHDVFLFISAAVLVVVCGRGGRSYYCRCTVFYLLQLEAGVGVGVWYYSCCCRMLIFLNSSGVVRGCFLLLSLQDLFFLQQ